jgi:hypothetical protein
VLLVLQVAAKWPELGAQFEQLAAGLRHATAPHPMAAAEAPPAEEQAI